MHRSRNISPKANLRVCHTSEISERYRLNQSQMIYECFFNRTTFYIPGSLIFSQRPNVAPTATSPTCVSLTTDGFLCTVPPQPYIWRGPGANKRTTRFPPRLYRPKHTHTRVVSLAWLVCVTHKSKHTHFQRLHELLQAWDCFPASNPFQQLSISSRKDCAYI